VNYFIFLVIFEELLNVAIQLKLPKGCMAGNKNEKVSFKHKILDFYLFIIKQIADGSARCNL
jgi:hypothetical protein